MGGQLMKTKTHVSAGLMSLNHHETLLRDRRKARGLKVKTHIRAGLIMFNHNETLVQDRARKLLPP
jgi:hypothetical protein